MPPALCIAVVVPSLPRHGAAGRRHALRVAGALAACGCDVLLVAEHLPPETPGGLRTLAALPPGPPDWLLLAAPAEQGDNMIAAALARAPGTRLCLLEPDDWPPAWPAALAPGGGMLLGGTAVVASLPGWRVELWPPDAAPALLADILLRGAEAVAPRPGTATASSSENALMPLRLGAAHRSSGGDLLLSLRAVWPGPVRELRAHSPGGPVLPLLWTQAGDDVVDAVVIAPPGLDRHPVVLRAIGEFGQLRQQMRLDNPPPPPAAAAGCTLHADTIADGWRLLHGEARAAAPLAALRFSPDGQRWLDATLLPAAGGATGFVLEYRPEPQDEPDQARLLLLGEGHVALDLLVGWPPRPGRHRPGPAVFGVANGLQAVAAGLAARVPGLRAVLADDPALLDQLRILPPEAGIALLPFTEAEAAAWAHRAGGLALAESVPAVPDPALSATAPVLALDGIGAPPDLLARAIAAALPVAARAGLQLAVVVDAPPLEPLARLRARLDLPEEVLPVWPQGLAAAGPDSVRALADLGAGHGVPAAVALARGIPAGLWTELALPGVVRPWPALPLPAILALPSGKKAGEENSPEPPTVFD
ncbi:hypothetical protein [Roseomonas haemaphysalidis]|uniref:Uncharacterized protein n=1 Tax=Roseomonas haemaphysalidis TaxID=2768162 RepID=A0ABS3KT71_9PROT|nr:hypothetical protein [Roseomonas haemaphysalidis]MBO1080668.1 hypothetical protein [Roseomonas haemaphysalidis]